MPDTKSAAQPRRWRLQFSLKLLLIAFTAFAIGFPIWYRWPYEETTAMPGGSLIITWQRQWGGGRAKHGLERWVAGGSGQTVQSIIYRNGLRHGPYTDSQGTRGQYENGSKEGVWTEPNRTTSWHRGKLDGPMELRLQQAKYATTPPKYWAKQGDQTWKDPGQELRVLKLMFSAGRLTHMDGKPVADSRGKSPANRLFELQGTGTINSITENELGKQTTLDVVEMPLKDTVLYLTEVHNIPLVLDPKLGPKLDLPLTATYRGLDLCTVLLLITAPNGLACDYRYGCVWITTTEDGADWRDQTGINDIKPSKGTALANVWNEVSPAVDTVQTPLTEALAYLKQPLAIEIDTSQIEEATETTSPPLVTASLRGLKFCDTLGQLLYKTGCRCRLEGETLVILPPLEKKTDSVPEAAKTQPRAGIVPAPGPPPKAPGADPFAPSP